MLFRAFVHYHIIKTSLIDEYQAVSKITIIGAGEIGKALGFVLQVTPNDINFWDRDLGKVPDQDPLKEIIPQADYILLCVPSWELRGALESISRLVSPQSVIMTPSKGIEEQSLKNVGVIMEELLPNNPMALISGPMLAEELMLGKNGFAVVASKSEIAIQKILLLFKDTGLHLQPSDDLIGVALCGVLKNIYSVSLGIADGLELGNNVKGGLALQAIWEMSLIVEILGGQRETVLGLAGIADFIATGFSDFSRNRKSGFEMGKRGTCELKSEGVASVRSIVTMLGPINDFPLLSALDRACVQSQDTKAEFEKLLVSI